MIVYSQAPQVHPPAYAHVTELDAEQSQRMRASAEPDLQRLRSFTFPQTVFPVDRQGQLLRLWEPLTLRIDPVTNVFFVEDWPIEMPCDDVHLLPRQIVRTFLIFLGKADSGKLTDMERKTWLAMLDTVDFTRFSIGRSPPHYMEGKVLKNGGRCRVEWVSGRKEWLSPKTGTALAFLDPGDEFSAYAKLGSDSETLFLERVSILAAV